MSPEEYVETLKNLREVEKNTVSSLKSMCESLASLVKLNPGYEFRERHEIAIAELEEALKQVRISIKKFEDMPKPSAG